MLTYAVVSPAKDEQDHIETTLRSMVGQTVRPVKWVIVDDGSSDQTAEIAETYAGKHPWISVLRLQKRGERAPGSPVMQAFRAGLQLLKGDKFDCIVKLDCDLRIPSTYFERLLEKFANDPRLGIASGVYVEHYKDVWKPVPMPEYHASGASKVIRAECFTEIGGFVDSRGWDTVDEIRAQARGWGTRHFPELMFEHLRPEGSARGPLYTSALHGEVYYLTGGPPTFFLLKVVHRMIVGRPVLVAGLMLLKGYLSPMLRGRKRLVSKEEAQYYRRSLNRRVWSSLAGAQARLRERESQGLI